MKGGWLPIDTYSGAAEGGPFPLSAHDLEAALKCLEADGLVASIYERLAVCDLDKQLEGGGLELQTWLGDYSIVPIDRE